VCPQCCVDCQIRRWETGRKVTGSNWPRLEVRRESSEEDTGAAMHMEAGQLRSFEGSGDRLLRLASALGRSNRL
jgi:hypothetical protein